MRVIIVIIIIIIGIIVVIIIIVIINIIVGDECQGFDRVLSQAFCGSQSILRWS